MREIINLQEFFISEGWGESRSVSDFANFQEFFISQGWGESRSVSDFANYQEFFISEGCGDNRSVRDFANFQEFFISEEWGESRNVSDFPNFQEFFISEGWGECRAECERLGKFPGILHYSGVGGEQSRMSATWQISRNSSFLRGGGGAELSVRDLANFQEFFISEGWGRAE